MANENAKIDSNNRPTLTAVTDDSNAEIRRLVSNPSTGALKASVVSLPDDISVQKIIVSKNGSQVGTRDQVNFIEGSNVTLTVSDDSPNNRVNVTVNSTSSGTGDVVGPASSTDNAITRFDGTTGKLIQNSTVTLGDTGNIDSVGNISGKAGGITITGGTAASENLLLKSTSNATKGYINLGSATNGGFFHEDVSSFVVGTTRKSFPVFSFNANSRGVFAKDSGESVATLITLAADANSELFGTRFNGSLASPTIVSNNDTLFQFGAMGYDGSYLQIGSQINFEVDGTPGVNDMPGRIVFYTTPDGSASPAESFRVKKDQNIQFANGVSLQTAQSAGNTLNLQAYDVDGAAYTTFATLTANNTPTMDLTTSVTRNGVAIADISSSQTFTNKTLTSPIISTISNTGTLTLPTSTDTLVGRDTTDTLTNKTLTAPRIANAGFIADANGNEQIIFTTTASAVNEITFNNAATGANPKFSATGGDSNVGIDFQGKGTGTYRFLGTSSQAAEIRLFEDTDDGSNYTAFKVGTQSADITYTLPTAQGAASTYLQNNGSGVLSWASASASSSYLANVSADSANAVVTIQNLADTGYYTITSSGTGSTSSKYKANTYKFTAGNAAGRFTVCIETASGAESYSGNYGFVVSALLSSTTSQDVYWGFDNGGIVYSAGGVTQNATASNDHAGFYIEDGTLYASNGNGTSQTRTNISSGVTLTNLNSYYLKGTTSSIEFYVNNSLKATHTTNLPDSSDASFRVGIESQTTATKELNFTNGFPIQTVMTF